MQKLTKLDRDKAMVRIGAVRLMFANGARVIGHALEVICDRVAERDASTVRCFYGRHSERTDRHKDRRRQCQ